MSIFGKALDINVNSKINSLRDKVTELLVTQKILSQTVQQPAKQTFLITIVAETRNNLTWGELFSFGNGGKVGGFVTNVKGKILGMGLYSKRSDGGQISVGIVVNDEERKGYGITISDTSGYRNFSTPWEVDSGDVINFISKTTNNNVENTVASLLMQI